MRRDGAQSSVERGPAHAEVAGDLRCGFAGVDQLHRATDLTAAASIFGVEARHAAILGVLGKKEAEGGVYKGAFEKPATRATVLKAASPFIVKAQTL